MTPSRQGGAFLFESIEHGPGTELVLIEGDSAAGALERARADRWQALFAMQGKIPNALRATERKIRNHAPCAELFELLGTGIGPACDLSRARYERVVFCPDPDEDGGHMQGLLTVLFLRWLRPWLEAGRVFAVRAPLFRLTTDTDEVFYAGNPRQRDEMVRRIGVAGRQAVVTSRFKGIGQMEAHELARFCLDPKTRKLTPIDVAVAERDAATFEKFLAT